MLWVNPYLSTTPVVIETILEPLTYAINGYLFTVYNALGNLWNEEVYEKVLESELSSQGLAVQRRKEFEVFYFDKRVGRYRMDLLVRDAVII